MVTREFVAILGFDEDAASRYEETNGLGDTAPGDFLEREFGWLEQSGISLENWALVDSNVKWERYITYLVEWAISHSSEDYMGMMPAGYDEWCACEDSEEV